MAANKTFPKVGRKSDVKKLDNKEVKNIFILEMMNRLKILQTEEELEAHDKGNKEEITDEEVVEKKQGEIREALTEVSENTIGYRDRNKKTRCQQRHGKRLKKENTSRSSLIGQKQEIKKISLQAEYKEVDKKVKQSTRNDKCCWIEQQAITAEEAAKKGDLKQLYKTT